MTWRRWELVDSGAWKEGEEGGESPCSEDDCDKARGDIGVSGWLSRGVGIPSSLIPTWDRVNKAELDTGGLRGSSRIPGSDGVTVLETVSSVHESDDEDESKTWSMRCDMAGLIELSRVEYE